MKKLLFVASVLVSLLCSCGDKENPTPAPGDETPDKVIINLEVPFSYTFNGKEYKTSFDSLNVKVVLKLGDETIPQEVTASNGFPWKYEKEVSLAGKTSIPFELYPEFSVKDENNLPTKVDLAFIPKGTFTFKKNGNVVPVSASKVQISWQEVKAGGFKMKEMSIDEVKRHLENYTKRGTSKGTIAW